VRAFSGATGAELFTVAGDASADGFGSVVRALGDVNGDGVPDFAACYGLPHLQLGGPAVRVISGAPAALCSDRHELSAAAGGTQVLSIDATAGHAGRDYLVLGSASGVAPGFDLFGAHVPLNPDAWFWFTATAPALFPGSAGVLDANGTASAHLHVPPLPFLQGLTLDHAVLVIGNGTIDLVSCAVPLTLSP
jgi:hypothetical protein